MDKDSLKPIIESLIFAADTAISLEKIASVLEGEEKPLIKEALNELIEDRMNDASTGICIEEVAGGFQFRTKAESAPWLRRFFKIGMQKISKAAMESLAIVAYKQPLTRGELEAIRGVDSGGVIATLMDRRFIKIVGRKEAPGRPVVYGTTKEFLETFDLKDLSCLPSLKDLKLLEEENATEENAAEGEKNAGEQEQAGAQGQGTAESETNAGQAEHSQAEPDATEGNGKAEEGSAESPEDAGGAGERTSEAPEDNSGSGDNIEEKGRGADHPGQGDGEPSGGDDTGGQG